MKKGNALALLPIGVFLWLYLGLGLVFEYVMKIPMGFYNVPIVIAFLAAILVACLQNKNLNFEQKLELMGRGIGDKNIMTMLLIFEALEEQKIKLDDMVTISEKAASMGGSQVF